MAEIEWVLVPREPTREMWAAAGTEVCDLQRRGIGHHDLISEAVYSAMLSAAPQPYSQEEGEVTRILGSIAKALDSEPMFWYGQEHVQSALSDANELLLSQASQIEALRKERDEWQDRANRQQVRAVAAETKLAEAIKVIEPFANAVFNDNCDMTVNLSAAQPDDFIRAYFFSRRNFLDANGGGQ